jgi:hypothetical protein
MDGEKLDAFHKALQAFSDAEERLRELRVITSNKCIDSQVGESIVEHVERGERARRSGRCGRSWSIVRCSAASDPLTARMPTRHSSP